uniref:Uncharacterized protein n=1 Tax=Siphoviridae sp. ctzyE57 TaxID=2827982 RepID=A0A8S5SHK8_9CAUD|nr:MAG TPA: hypothetical protein [Siphoviridae sp. ctzyE57]
MHEQIEHVVSLQKSPHLYKKVTGKRKKECDRGLTQSHFCGTIISVGATVNLRRAARADKEPGQN